MKLPMLMIDSGAFSVWKNRASIDLDQYTQFCVQEKEASYYVNLDVIPGSPSSPGTNDDVERAAKQSWVNYQRMLSAGVPIEKLIPVYHQHESRKWLDKYMDFGTPYLGISPANDRSAQERKQWLESLKRHVCGSGGRPLVKMHGFGVTSHQLLTSFPWHSVDSASWIKTAAYGNIWIPRKTNGSFDYSKRAVRVPVTPEAASKEPPWRRFDNLRWEYVREFLSLCSTDLQSVRTTLHERNKVNAVFIAKQNKALAEQRCLTHIYFAGHGGIAEPVVPAREPFFIERKLMSFKDIRKQPTMLKLFRHYLEFIRETEERVL